MGKVPRKKEDLHFKIGFRTRKSKSSMVQEKLKIRKIYISFIEIGDVNMCRFHKMIDLFEMMPVQYVEFVIYGAIKTIKVKVSDYFERSS